MSPAYTTPPEKNITDNPILLLKVKTMTEITNEEQYQSITGQGPMVTIIMGSLSDRKVGERAEKVLKELEVSYQLRVASAHRTPEKVREIMETSGSSIFIGIAGMAAHLPGVMASHTTKPIIAVPVSASFNGFDALLAAVQMPPGIPVATVTVDRGDNAAILAAEILALGDDSLASRLLEYREKMKEKVNSHDRELNPDI